MKNMADYTLDDKKWNARVAMIESHMKTNDVGDMKAVLQWNLKNGTTDVDNRKRYWSNITNMFATVENSPIQIGKRSTLPQAVQDSISAICVVYAEGFSALFASHPLYGEVLRARGTAGYEAYSDADAYASSQVSNLKTRLTGYYKNHTDELEGISWDGTVNKSGVPNFTCPEMEVEG
jgi:hypothetical protein